MPSSLFASLLVFSWCALLIIPNRVYGQSQDCNGLTFTDGSLVGWSGWAGKRNNSGAVISLNSTSLPNSDRILVHTAASSDFIEPNKICTVQIPWVPPGFPRSLQIGNIDDGSQIDRAAYTLLVDSTNASILMDVAVFFEYNDDHNANVQPKFDISISTADGIVIPCGFFNVIAGYNIPGFEEQPDHLCYHTPKPIQYLPWKLVSIDLSAYIGQLITFTFTAYDCSQGEHFGFGVVALKCQEIKVNSSIFCPGISSSITLSAPEGFTDYVWSNGATTPTITIQNPLLGQTYWVKFKPFSSLTGACESYLKFEIPDGHNIVPTSLQFCEGLSVAVKTTAPTGSKYQWSTGQSTAEITVSLPGDYFVTVTTPNNCEFRDTAHVEQVRLPHYTLQIQQPTCAGASDGSICAVLDNSQQPATFTWSAGQNQTGCLEAIGAGVYTVTAKETILGCSLTSSASVSEPLPLSSQTSVLRSPHCRDWETGKVNVAVAGGTAPYQIQWSNGAVGAQAEILDEGWYSVSITDAHGCFLTDSVQIAQLRYTLFKKDNACFAGKNAEIAITLSGGFPPYMSRLFPNYFEDQFIYTDLSSQIYRLEMMDELGCVLEDSIAIVDLQKEPYRISPTPTDTTIEFGKPIRIQLHPNNLPANTYWPESFFGDFPTHNDGYVEGRPLNSGTIEIFSTDVHGCLDTAVVLIKVVKIYNVYLPDAFAPGHNSDNRLLKPSFDPHQVNNIESFEVFDRWGACLYKESAEKGMELEGWDGTYCGKPLEPGVFIYLVKVWFQDGAVRIYSNDATLLR